MRWPLLARCFVALGCLAGCAALAGIDDSKTPADAADSGIDIPPREGGVAGEGGGTLPDGAPCETRTVVPPAGPIHAKHATLSPQVDGKLDDWTCVDRLDMGSGKTNNNMPPGMQSVTFAFQWTDSDVFLYAHVVTTMPGLDNTGSAVFANDSVHLIIGRDPPNVTDGLYRTGDHQLTIDYKNRVGDYVNGLSMKPQIDSFVLPGQAASGAIDYQVEARIPAASLGVPAGTKLTSAQRLVVNFQLVDAQSGGAPFGFRVWRLPPLATCPCVKNGCCERIGSQNSPTCDMRCTEKLVLDD